MKNIEKARNLFSLPNVNGPLKPNELLGAIQFWQGFPAHFTSYVAFCSRVIRRNENRISLIVLKDDDQEEIFPLEFKDSNSVDLRVKVMGETQPVDLIQFHALISQPTNSFKRLGFRFLKLSISNIENDQIGRMSVLGEIRNRMRRDDAEGQHDIEVSITRFTLPGLQRQFTDLIAREMEARCISSGNFIRSSDICISVAINYQRFWTVNYGTWSNCLNLHAFQREFPNDAKVVYEAEKDLEQLIRKVEAERRSLVFNDPNGSANNEVTLKVSVNCETFVVTIDGKEFPLKGSNRVRQKLADFIQKLIDARGEYVPKPPSIKSETIANQPEEVFNLIDSQPGAGTRITREKLGLN